MSEKMKNQNRLVVADAGWAETIPAWLLDEVKKERMVSGFVGVMRKGDNKCGLAEATIYLYTLSLRQPMDDHMARIYLYITGKVMERTGRESPDFTKDITLTAEEERKLDELRESLYDKRGGEIKSPLFDMLKAMKKEFAKDPKGKGK